jgi:nucleotide-binding universal stress UspA family protein
MITRRKIFIATLVVFVAGLHYFSTMKNMPLHEFYRELFFVPAILAGLWGGKKSGLTTSVIISVLFLPHIIRTMGTTESALLLNLFEIALFNLAGGLAGIYGDAKRQHDVSLNIPYRPVSVQREEKQWLLFMDGTQASFYAASYAAGLLKVLPGVVVTLFCILEKKDADFFESTEEERQYHTNVHQEQQKLMDQAREILMQLGVAEERILSKLMKSDKKEVVVMLLEEIKSGTYDAVVIAKHPRTKAEEFIFGSITIRLIREGVGNIIVVPVPAETEKKKDDDLARMEELHS